MEVELERFQLRKVRALAWAQGGAPQLREARVRESAWVQFTGVAFNEHREARDDARQGAARSPTRREVEAANGVQWGALCDGDELVGRALDVKLLEQHRA